MKKLVFAALTILITLLVVSCTTLGGKPVVDIAFYLNGGFWSKEDLESTRPDATLTINEFDNYNGDNTKLTLFTPTDTELTRTYHVTVPHKKSLARPIASSYIWRNYDAVDDRFFETLDIINTAFLKADANGNFTVTTALNDIHTYIMPKAKQYGNWVVFSIAPESEWASIARNAT